MIKNTCSRLDVFEEGIFEAIVSICDKYGWKEFKDTFMRSRKNFDDGQSYIKKLVSTIPKRNIENDNNYIEKVSIINYVIEKMFNHRNIDIKFEFLELLIENKFLKHYFEVAFNKWIKSLYRDEDIKKTSILLFKFGFFEFVEIIKTFIFESSEPISKKIGVISSLIFFRPYVGYLRTKCISFINKYCRLLLLPRDSTVSSNIKKNVVLKLILKVKKIFFVYCLFV